jgi:cytochrome d ubiquinol oxidase subunit II
LAAAVFFPIVLLYQGYTYVVLRRRVGGPTMPVERIEEPPGGARE